MGFEPRISIVTLGVSDMARARTFYEKLGWKPAPASNESVTFFQGRGIVLGLYGHDALAEDAGIQSCPPARHRGVALAYNCGSRGAVDAAYDHALKSGAEGLKAPQEAFWGGYSGYFADPDGHLWEVAHNPFAPLDVDGHLRVEDTQ